MSGLTVYRILKLDEYNHLTGSSTHPSIIPISSSSKSKSNKKELLNPDPPKEMSISRPSSQFIIRSCPKEIQKSAQKVLTKLLKSEDFSYNGVGEIRYKNTRISNSNIIKILIALFKPTKESVPGLDVVRKILDTTERPNTSAKSSLFTNWESFD